MLTNTGHTSFVRPLTIKDAVLAALAMMILALLLVGSARAEGDDSYNFRLVVDRPAYQDNDYSYRKETDKRTVALMLYGFQTSEEAVAAPAPSNNGILKDRKALSGFFKQHWQSVKRDYLGQDGTQSMQVLAGEDSFTSVSLNRGIGIEPAKMVGVTIPSGRFTVGAGYTWGEENPAMMMRTTTEGFMVGMAYDTGTVGYQLSYLTSGQEVAGMEIGGTDIRYDSIMFGASWRVNERMGVTSTIQYRRDNDQLTTGDSHAVFTVGTKWKF
jgi:hypothetical protein